MKITINGEPHEIEQGLSIFDLAATLELAPDKIAIERNRSIVPRSTFAETRLCDGDHIEIVCFVGGG
ncbi:MAG: sulfur carrier protein ThiS [Pseudomonadota bacterium]